jgi:DNA-nicking Smr family endonuclease
VRKGPRRRLRPEERRLWDRVAASTHPLRADRSPKTRPEGRAGHPRETTPEAGEQHLEQDSGIARSPPFELPPTDRTGAPVRPVGRERVRGATSVGLALPEAGPVGRPQAGLDRRTAERLRKGARAPDAGIDLHGMTAERAHRAALRFLGEAIARGHRLVLVITGKGGRGDAVSSRGRGVLRDALPGWLRASPQGQSIVGIYQAHRRHGGEGAFYVYLKRHR